MMRVVGWMFSIKLIHQIFYLHIWYLGVNIYRRALKFKIHIYVLRLLRRFLKKCKFSPGRWGMWIIVKDACKYQIFRMLALDLCKKKTIKFENVGGGVRMIEGIQIIALYIVPSSVAVFNCRVLKILRMLFDYLSSYNCIYYVYALEQVRSTITKQNKMIYTHVQLYQPNIE